MLTRLRNIGISAHIDAGKTTVAERILFYCGRIHTMREIRGGDDGPTMDSHPIEKDRGITIASAATRVAWNDHWINLIDTPGHVDFTVEVERSLRVLDGAVLVVCAAGGVQSQTTTVDRQMRRYSVPRIAFVNKMDLVGAAPGRVVDELRSKLKTNALPLQVPIGRGSDFAGVIDLVTMQGVYFDGDHGQTVRRGDIPNAYVDQAKEARAEMLEALGLIDDRVMESVLAEQVPSIDLLRRAIRRVTIERLATPVLFGSAYKNKGVQEVLDAVVHYLPSPDERAVHAQDLAQSDNEDAELIALKADPTAPTVAMAFKTVVGDFGQLTYLRVYQGCIEKSGVYRSVHSGRKVRFGRLVRLHANKLKDMDRAEAGDIVAVVGVDCVTGDTFLGQGANCALLGIHVADPVMSLTIAPHKSDDSDRLARALERFRREDPTFHVGTDPMSGETLISGMGRLHLDVIVQKIRDEFGCPCRVGAPQVAYKQRPTKRVEFDYKRNKQTGGPGQYGHVVGYMEPLLGDYDEAMHFRSEISGGRIPSEYIPSVAKGFSESMSQGPLGEFEVVGLSIVLRDGSYHDKDSSDLAFMLCARDALRMEILPRANMVLLEPMMKLEVETPDEFQGAVNGHLARIRGIVSDVQHRDSVCVIQAQVPLAELFNFADELRSMTKGNGTFTMEFACYTDCPQDIQDRVVG